MASASPTAQLERDEFDEVPTDLARVGAHRAPAPRGRGWLRLLWGVVAVVLLAVVGLWGVSRVVDFELPDLWGSTATAAPAVTPDPVATADPVTDPAAVDPALGLTLSVINASGTAGAQTAVADALAALGWPDPARAAADSELETTTVYYWTAGLEGVARGIAAQVGATQVLMSDVYRGASVTVVLGTDYTPAS